MSPSTSAQPKTLAEDLRGRSDDHIARLLTSRPDLLHPVPSDMRALTTRAATSPSIARYLDTVDCLHHFALRIASEQTATQPTTLEQVVDAIVREVCDESIRIPAQDAVEQLRLAALLWGTDERLHVVTAVRDQVAAAPVPTWPAPSCNADHADIDASAIEQADGRGGIVAQELIETIEEIGDLWALTPGPVLRSGGLSARALEALAASLGRPKEEITICLDLAWNAGLVAQGSTGSDIGWMPTAAFESWGSEPAAKRWAVIARAWRDRASITGDRPLVDTENALIRTWRSHLLAVLTDAPRACDLPTALAIVDYRWPRRRGIRRTEVLEATWTEAEQLGILVDGVLTDAGRSLASDAASAALASSIARTLPSEVDRVHIQADHTIVAPGPLEPALGRRLRMIADVESRGHATVFRLTNASIKRALSIDPDPESWQQFLTDIGSKGLPQPVAYLINDAARKIPAHQQLHTAPAAPTPVRHAPIKASPTRVEKALDILRARDERHIPQLVAELTDEEIPTMEGAAIVAALRYSIDHHETVRISHAESDGSTALLLVDPIRLGGGSLTAYDHHEEQVRTFAISRISGVATVRISA